MNEPERRAFQAQLAQAAAMAAKQGRAIIGGSWIDGQLRTVTAPIRRAEPPAEPQASLL